jgi:hypothetical protein
MLGFNIDADCGIWTQVKTLKARFRQRIWTLRLAVKAGLSEKDMLLAYKTHIRPVVESNSVIVQPLITAEQSELLERQQTLALKIIYGPGLSAEKLRKRAGVERLEVRRIEACRTFVRKNLGNERTKQWFTERPEPLRGRRSNAEYRPYIEERARTDRRFNSPIFYYRRIANDLFKQ